MAEKKSKPKSAGAKEQNKEQGAKKAQKLPKKKNGYPFVIDN